MTCKEQNAYAYGQAPMTLTWQFILAVHVTNLQVQAC